MRARAASFRFMRVTQTGRDDATFPRSGENVRAGSPGCRARICEFRAYIRSHSAFSFAHRNLYPITPSAPT
jgi:hypothetical protein